MKESTGRAELLRALIARIDSRDIASVILAELLSVLPQNGVRFNDEEAQFIEQALSDAVLETLRRLEALLAPEERPDEQEGRSTNRSDAGQSDDSARAVSGVGPAGDCAQAKEVAPPAVELEALLASEERPDEQPEGHVVLDSSGDRSDVVGENHRLVDRQEQVAPPAVSAERLRERLRVRIESLVNRGREICVGFVALDGAVSCADCGYTADVHLLRDLYAALASPASVYPIPLNEQQERAIKEWAADDRLWTTQGTVEFNLRLFARTILKKAAEAEPATGFTRVGETFSRDRSEATEEELARLGDGIIDRYFSFEPRRPKP